MKQDTLIKIEPLIAKALDNLAASKLFEKTGNAEKQSECETTCDTLLSEVRTICLDAKDDIPTASGMNAIYKRYTSRLDRQAQ